MFGQHEDESTHNETPVTAPSTDAVVAPTDTPSTTQSWQHPGSPLGGDDSGSTESTTDNAAPSSPTAPSIAHIGSDEGSDIAPASVSTDDLVAIKQQALTQLSPLVGHLDQSPEEKFRTTMMMIQASDDQTLVKTAYEAAQKIEDEKTRAQALLDIVNEINYFTQHSQN